jgi:transcriptional regulator with XRE-family HTH domain
MKWEGIKIKEFADAKKLSLQVIANTIGVSRQTVNDWIKGQIPKGNHLLLLCKLFSVTPNNLFFDDSAEYISIPVHRRRMNSKITNETQEAAKSLSKDYFILFKNHKTSAIVPVIRTYDRGTDNARKIASDLRMISGISNDKPIDYEHTFKLLKHLGIHVILKDFPTVIKSYAFYTKIFEHRVVFVNNSTNILDLIFPLLHESIHAIRDENIVENEYDDEEENFCDQVANFIQFPETYVNMIYDTINNFNKPTQINTLKSFAKVNSHSLYGIVKSLKMKYSGFSLNIGGADSNLKKEFPTIGNIIFNKDDPRKLIKVLKKLSPNFISLIEQQIDSITTRKLADILSLTSILDAKELKFELAKEIAYEASV